MARSFSAARRGALYLLNGVFGAKRLLSEIKEDPFIQELKPQERATAQRLCLSCLRVLSHVDDRLDRHLSKKPTSHVHQILRIGAAELIHGGDAHGVVNDWVQITKSNQRYRGSSGLVNAVLRKISQEGTSTEQARNTLPDWLRLPMVSHYGEEAVHAMEGVFSQNPPVDLSLKEQGKDAQGHWAKRLGAKTTPFGSIRLDQGVQISKLAGYGDGAWWVQDSAASVPVQALNLPKGAKVLDIGAAPGGKTMQLAARGYIVTALDKSAARVAKIRENLKRTKLRAQIITQDAFEHQSHYDAVILDAPCSATGTLRRHPELPYVKSMDQFEPLIELQGRLLDHAAGLVTPGGQLIFCTCSLLPQEGEHQIKEFIQRKPDFKVSMTAFEGLDVQSQWRTPEGGLRLRPDYWADLGGMDGFYIAVLEKHH